jgi:hypothetical protein
VRRCSHLGFGSSRCGLYAAGASSHGTCTPPGRWVSAEAVGTGLGGAGGHSYHQEAAEAWEAWESLVGLETAAPGRIDTPRWASPPPPGSIYGLSFIVLVLILDSLFNI